MWSVGYEAWSTGACETAGHLVRAIELCERTLAARERIFGNDHQDTLNSRNDLAYAHGTGGDLPLAIKMFETARADALGPDHRRSGRTVRRCPTTPPPRRGTPAPKPPRRRRLRGGPYRSSTLSSGIPSRSRDPVPNS
ncbi:tetratricopeptide repeat protein [Amycolatopsis coloradensis]|uniref:tetratricopeptide repeat protein n=1 Tax=Amycolatopsis coloradensis TaxID=76021 RepID=UPI00340C220B